MLKQFYLFTKARDVVEDNTFLTIWDHLKSWTSQNDWISTFLIILLGIIFVIILTKICTSFQKTPAPPENGGLDSQENEGSSLTSMTFDNWSSHSSSEERVDDFSESTITSSLTSEESESNIEKRVSLADEIIWSDTSDSNSQVSCFSESHTASSNGSSSFLSLFDSEIIKNFPSQRGHPENGHEIKQCSSKELFSMMKTNKKKSLVFPSDLNFSRASGITTESKDVDVAPCPPAHFFLSRDQVRLLEENVKLQISLKSSAPLESKSTPYSRSQEFLIQDQHSVRRDISAQAQDSFPRHTTIQNQGFYETQFTSQAQQFVNNQDLINSQPDIESRYHVLLQNLRQKPLSSSTQDPFQTQDLKMTQHERIYDAFHNVTHTTLSQPPDTEMQSRLKAKTDTSRIMGLAHSMVKQELPDEKEIWNAKGIEKTCIFKKPQEHGEEEAAPEEAVPPLIQDFRFNLQVKQKPDTFYTGQGSSGSRKTQNKEEEVQPQTLPTQTILGTSPCPTMDPFQVEKVKQSTDRYTGRETTEPKNPLTVPESLPAGEVLREIPECGVPFGESPRKTLYNHVAEEKKDLKRVSPAIARRCFMIHMLPLLYFKRQKISKRLSRTKCVLNPKCVNMKVKKTAILLMPYINRHGTPSHRKRLRGNFKILMTQMLLDEITTDMLLNVTYPHMSILPHIRTQNRSNTQNHSHTKLKNEKSQVEREEKYSNSINKESDSAITREEAKLQDKVRGDKDTPPKAVLHDTPLNAVLRVIPPNAVLRDTPRRAVLRDTTPRAVLQNTPPRAVLWDTPPRAVLRDTLPRLLWDTPPRVVLRDTLPRLLRVRPPRAVLWDTPPRAVLRDTLPRFLRDTSPRAVLRDIPPRAVLQYTTPRAVLRDTLPRLLRDTPPRAVLWDTPPRAVLRDTLPRLLRDTPPRAVLWDTPPRAVLRDTPSSAVLRDTPPRAGSLIGDPLNQIRENDVSDYRSDARGMGYCSAETRAEFPKDLPATYPENFNCHMPVSTHSKVKKKRVRFSHINYTVRPKSIPMKIGKPSVSPSFDITGHREELESNFKTKFGKINIANELVYKFINTLFSPMQSRSQVEANGFCHSQIKQGEITDERRTQYVDFFHKNSEFFNTEEKVQDGEEVEAAPQPTQHFPTDMCQGNKTNIDEPDTRPNCLTQEVQCQTCFTQTALQTGHQIGPRETEELQKTNKTAPMGLKIPSPKAWNSSLDKHLNTTTEYGLQSDGNPRKQLDAYFVGKNSELLNDLQVKFLISSDSVKSFVSKSKRKKNMSKIARKQITVSCKCRTRKKKKLSIIHMLNDSQSRRPQCNLKTKMKNPQQKEKKESVTFDFCMPTFSTFKRKRNFKQYSDMKTLVSTKCGILKAKKPFISYMLNIKGGTRPNKRKELGVNLTTKKKDLDQGEKMADKNINMYSKIEKDMLGENRLNSKQAKQVISLCEGNITSDDTKEANLQAEEEEESEQERLFKIVPQHNQHFIFCSGEREELDLHKSESDRSRKILFIMEQDVSRQMQTTDPMQMEKPKRSHQTQNGTLRPASSKLPPLKSKESLIGEVLIDMMKCGVPSDGSHTEKLHSHDKEEKAEFQKDQQATVTESLNATTPDPPHSKRQSRTFAWTAFKSKMNSKCVIMKAKKPPISQVFNIPWSGCLKNVPLKTLKSQMIDFLIHINDSAVLEDLTVERKEGLTQEVSATILESSGFSTLALPPSKRNNLKLIHKKNKTSAKCVTLKAKKAPISETFNITKHGTPSYRRQFECDFKTMKEQDKPVAISSAMPVSFDMKVHNRMKVETGMPWKMKFSHELRQQEQSPDGERARCDENGSTSNTTKKDQAQGREAALWDSQHFSFHAYKMKEPHFVKSDLALKNSSRKRTQESLTTAQELQETLFTQGVLQSISCSILNALPFEKLPKRTKTQKGLNDTRSPKILFPMPGTSVSEALIGRAESGIPFEKIPRKELASSIPEGKIRLQKDLQVRTQESFDFSMLASSKLQGQGNAAQTPKSTTGKVRTASVLRTVNTTRSGALSHGNEQDYILENTTKEISLGMSNKLIYTIHSSTPVLPAIKMNAKVKAKKGPLRNKSNITQLKQDEGKRLYTYSFNEWSTSNNTSESKWQSEKEKVKESNEITFKAHLQFLNSKESRKDQNMLIAEQEVQQQTLVSKNILELICPSPVPFQIENLKKTIPPQKDIRHRTGEMFSRPKSRKAMFDNLLINEMTSDGSPKRKLDVSNDVPLQPEEEKEDIKTQKAIKYTVDRNIPPTKSRNSVLGDACTKCSGRKMGGHIAKKHKGLQRDLLKISTSVLSVSTRQKKILKFSKRKSRTGRFGVTMKEKIPLCSQVLNITDYVNLCCRKEQEFNLKSIIKDMQQDKSIANAFSFHTCVSTDNKLDIETNSTPKADTDQPRVKMHSHTYLELEKSPCYGEAQKAKLTDRQNRSSYTTKMNVQNEKEEKNIQKLLESVPCNSRHFSFCVHHMKNPGSRKSKSELNSSDIRRICNLSCTAQKMKQEKHFRETILEPVARHVMDFLQVETMKKCPHIQEGRKCMGGRKTAFPKVGKSETGLMQLDTPCNGNPSTKWDSPVSEKKAWNKNDLAITFLKPSEFSILDSSESKRQSYMLAFVGKKSIMSPKHVILKAKKIPISHMLNITGCPVGSHKKKKQHKFKYKMKEKQWDKSVREAFLHATEGAKMPPPNPVMDKTSFHTSERSTLYRRALYKNLEEMTALGENKATTFLGPLDIFMPLLPDSESQINTVPLSKKKIILNPKCSTQKKKEKLIAQILKINRKFTTKHRKNLRFNSKIKMKEMWQGKNVAHTFLNAIYFTFDISDIKKQSRLKTEMDRVSRFSPTQPAQMDLPVEGLVTSQSLHITGHSALSTNKEQEQKIDVKRDKTVLNADLKFRHDSMPIQLHIEMKHSPSTWDIEEESSEKSNALNKAKVREEDEYGKQVLFRTTAQYSRPFQFGADQMREPGPSKSEAPLINRVCPEAEKRGVTSPLLPCSGQMASSDAGQSKYTVPPLNDITSDSKRTKHMTQKEEDNTYAFERDTMQPMCAALKAKKSPLFSILKTKELQVKIKEQVKRGQEGNKETTVLLSEICPFADSLTHLKVDTIKEEEGEPEIIRNYGPCIELQQLLPSGQMASTKSMDNYVQKGKQHLPQKEKDRAHNRTEVHKDLLEIVGWSPLQLQFPVSSAAGKIKYADSNEGISSSHAIVKLKSYKEAKNRVKLEDGKGKLFPKITVRTEISPFTHLLSRKQLHLKTKEQHEDVRKGKGEPGIVLRKTCASLPLLSHLKQDTRGHAKEDILGVTQTHFPPLKSQDPSYSGKKAYTKSFDSYMLGEEDRLKVDIEDKMQKGKVQEDKNKLVTIVENISTSLVTLPYLKFDAKEEEYVIRITELPPPQPQPKEFSNSWKIAYAETVDGELSNNIKELKEHMLQKEKNREEKLDVNGRRDPNDMYLNVKKSPIFLTNNPGELQWQTREQEGKVQKGTCEPPGVLLTKTDTCTPSPLHLNANSRIKENSLPTVTRSSVSPVRFHESSDSEEAVHVGPVISDILISPQEGKQQYVPQIKGEDGVETKNLMFPKHQEKKMQETKDEPGVLLTQPPTSLPSLPQIKLDKEILVDDEVLVLKRSVLRRILNAGGIVHTEPVGGDITKDVQQKQQRVPQQEERDRGETGAMRCSTHTSDKTLKSKKSTPSSTLYGTELHSNIGSQQQKKHEGQGKSSNLGVRKVYASKPPPTNFKLDKGTQVDKEGHAIKRLCLLPPMVSAMSDTEKVEDTEGMGGDRRKRRRHIAQKEILCKVKTVDMRVRLQHGEEEITPITHLFNRKELVLNIKELKEKVHEGKDESCVDLTRTFLSTPSASPLCLDSGSTIDKDALRITVSAWPRKNLQESLDTQKTAIRESVSGNSKMIVKKAGHSVSPEEAVPGWTSNVTTSVQQRKETPQDISKGDLSQFIVNSLHKGIYFTGFGTLGSGKWPECFFMEPEKYKTGAFSSFLSYPTMGPTKIANLKKETEMIDNLNHKTCPRAFVSLPKEVSKEMYFTFGTPVSSKEFPAPEEDDHPTPSKAFPGSSDPCEEQDVHSNEKTSKTFSSKVVALQTKRSLKKRNIRKSNACQNIEEQEIVMEKQVVQRAESGHKTRLKSCLSLKFPLQTGKQKAPLDRGAHRQTKVQPGLQNPPGMYTDITECDTVREKTKPVLFMPEQDECVPESFQQAPSPGWTSPLQSGDVKENNEMDTNATINPKQKQLEMKNEKLKIDTNIAVHLKKDKIKMHENTIVSLEKEKIKMKTSNTVNLNATPVKAEKAQIKTEIITPTADSGPVEQKRKRKQEVSNGKQAIQPQILFQKHILDSLYACTTLPHKSETQKGRLTINLRSDLSTKFLTMKIPKEPILQMLGNAGSATPSNRKKLKHDFNKPKKIPLGSESVSEIFIKSLSISIMSPSQSKETLKSLTNLEIENRVCLSKFQEKSTNASKIIKRNNLSTGKQRDQNFTNIVPEDSYSFVVDKQQMQNHPSVKSEANLSSEISKKDLTQQTEERVVPRHAISRIMKEPDLLMIEQEENEPKCTLTLTECPSMSEDPEKNVETHVKSTRSMNRSPPGVEAQSETQLFDTKECVSPPEQRDQSEHLQHTTTQKPQQQKTFLGTVPITPQIQNNEIKRGADSTNVECLLPLYEAIKHVCESQVKNIIKDKVYGHMLEKVKAQKADDWKSPPFAGGPDTTSTSVCPQLQPKPISGCYTPKLKNKLINHLESKALEIKLNQIPEMAKQSFQKFNFYPKLVISEDNSWRLDQRHKKMHCLSLEGVDTITINVKHEYQKDSPRISCTKTLIVNVSSGSKENTTKRKSINKLKDRTSSVAPVNEMSLSRILQNYSVEEKDKLLTHFAVKTLEIQMKAFPRIIMESYTMADRRKTFIPSGVKVPKPKNNILLLLEEISLCQKDLVSQYKFLLGLPVESMSPEPNTLPKHSLNLNTGATCEKVGKSGGSDSLSIDTELLEKHTSFEKQSPHENSSLIRQFLEPTQLCASDPEQHGTLKKDTTFPSVLKSHETPVKDKQYHPRFQETNTHESFDLKTSQSVHFLKDFPDSQTYIENSADSKESEDCLVLEANPYLSQESQNILLELQKSIALENVHERKNIKTDMKSLISEDSGSHHTKGYKKHSSVMTPTSSKSHKSKKYRSSSKTQSPNWLCHSEEISWITRNRTSYSLSPLKESNIKLPFEKSQDKPHTYSESQERKNAKFDSLRNNVHWDFGYTYTQRKEKCTRKKTVCGYESERASYFLHKRKSASKSQEDSHFHSERKRNQPFFYVCMPADSLEIMPKTFRWTLPPKTSKKSNFRVPLVASISSSCDM